MTLTKNDSEVWIMCNNNGICGCFSGNNWWWIIILVLLFCCGGCGNNSGYACANNGYNGGCGCDRCCAADSEKDEVRSCGK